VFQPLGNNATLHLPLPFIFLGGNEEEKGGGGLTYDDTVWHSQGFQKPLQPLQPRPCNIIMIEAAEFRGSSQSFDVC